MLIRLWALIGNLSVAIWLSTADVQALEIEDIIIKTFENAIVKVSVSSNSPVIVNSENICNSLGTGFLVSSSYIATAAHVVQNDSRCGSPVIVLRLRYHDIERPARVVGIKDDIALLKVDDPFPPSMCALRVGEADICDSNGLRFGIPGQLQDPIATAVKIGGCRSEFAPFVRLNSQAETGESGGPIIFQFNVVGVLKSRHKDYNQFSFMMIGSWLRSLMLEHHVSADGKICNPVELNTTREAAIWSLSPNKDLDAAAQKSVSSEIQKALNVVAATPQAAVRITKSGESFSVSGIDHKEVRQNCRPILGPFARCQTQEQIVSGTQSATKAAADVKKEVSRTLWGQFERGIQ